MLIVEVRVSGKRARSGGNIDHESWVLGARLGEGEAVAGG